MPTVSPCEVSNEMAVRHMMKWIALASLVLATSVAGQRGTLGTVVDNTARDATIDALMEKIATQYILPENTERITQALRSANRAGQYDGKTPQTFVEAVNITLRDASHDKHLSVFYDPLTPAPQTGAG